MSKYKESVYKFWEKFCESDPELNHLKAFKFDAWGFGDTKEMADELGALVDSNTKTATCSLYRAYKGHEDELPAAGQYDVILNGDKEPICIILTTHVWMCRYDEVDAELAFEEGEGDRSLDYWKKEHTRFFSKYDEEMGVPFKESDLLIFERFKKVY